MSLSLGKTQKPQIRFTIRKVVGLGSLLGYLVPQTLSLLVIRAPQE